MVAVCSYVAELCLCFARLCLYEYRYGTGATRTAFIFQATTIVAYLLYLWGLSHWNVPLAVYWTVEYLFVIGLGVQSVIYLKYKHY